MSESYGDDPPVRFLKSYSMFCGWNNSCLKTPANQNSEVSQLPIPADLSIVDLDIPFSLIFTVGATVNCYSNLAVLAVITWQVLFISLPIIYLAIRLQDFDWK
ncbi:multidrug resistance protein ABC transporter [Striga asiatica]|uniref:Multidrug resistance protein ABC transporter n=1 Tax=Striga asiatica TaxID=4170 RepID=A0A5A7PNY8_STRAF|nr:multidrug resistance protein ABC transporter [Striga asiatica]